MSKLRYKQVNNKRAESPLISQQFRDLVDKSNKFAATLTPRLEQKGLKNKSLIKDSQKVKPFNGSKTTRDPVSSLRATTKKKTLAKYTTKLDIDQKKIYRELNNNEEMRQNIIDSFRSGKQSVISNIKPKSRRLQSLSIKTPVKKELQTASVKNKKHVVTKSLLLIQNEISNVSAVQSPFMVSGIGLGDSILDNTKNSLALTKRFTSSSFQSPPRARKINLSKDLGQKSISSVKKSQTYIHTYRSVQKNEQKQSNSHRELIKNVNNYKDLNKQETTKSKKMSKNSKYLTNNNTQGQVKQKIRKPESNYQSQPNDKNVSRNPSMNLGQGQKSGFSLQLGGSSPKNQQNFQQNGNQYRNTSKTKPLQNIEVEEDIPLTDRTAQANSARHGLGDQYQMKTNLIANQNEVSYGQIQFQGDLGDDMPQSEVSDEESEQGSPEKQIPPAQMLQQPQIQPQQEEQKHDIYDYKNLRNQRKQNKQNTSDQMTSEMVNMININDSNQSSKLQQSTFIREPREELNHQPAIFSLSVAPEPVSVQHVQNNRSLNQNQMQYVEASTIPEVETSIEITRVPDTPKRTLQDYVKSLSPIEREMLKNNLAVLIQKWVRGHLTRIRYKQQKQINFKQMRKFRRMLTVAYNRLRSKQVKQIITVMKESGALHTDQNYQLWQKYKEHCAVMLQSHWQGYKARFLQIDEINMKIWDCKRSRLLTAIVKGFKTRLLLHEKGYHKALHLIRMEMNKIANQNNGKAMVIDVNDKLTLKNLMRKRRQKVVEYIRQFDKSMKSKSILVALLKARRGKPFNQNESQYMQTSKYDIGNTNTNIKSQEKKQLQTKKSAKRWQDAANDDEPAPLDSMWPSVSVSNANYGRDDSEEEEIKPKTAASFWPSKQKEEQESTEAASFWPSRQKEEQKEEESSLSSMWPSKMKEKKNKKAVVLEQYSDDDENDGDDIDWLNLPVKKPAVTNKEKPKPAPAKNQNFMAKAPQVVNDFDEQPVGANKPNNMQMNQEVIQFGVRNSGGVNGAINPMQEQVFEMPIRQSNIHGEAGESARAPPQYDFEKMIEEAMRNNGETPAVSAAPAVGEDQPVEQNKRILSKAKKVDPKKAALLAKRKSYDPRAAVKNAKTAEDKPDTSATGIISGDISQPIETGTFNNKGLDQSTMNQTELNKSQLDENEESPDQQQQPDRPPRPFLKRKTKALVIPKKKEEEKKTQGKSRIDCWQKDKDPNISYGNKKINRKSLLKKRSTNKVEDERSPFKPTPGSAAVQAQAEPHRTMAYRPSPIRARMNNLEELEENESAIPDENESNEISQNNINNGRPSEGLSPNNINFYADMQNQNDEEQFNFDGQKLQIDDLEEQFDFLHGANYCQRGDEFSLNNPLPENSKINSHDFKYSMIPFSEENNSHDVNLYSKQSRIPFLYKENMAEFGIKPQTPSLFFKCYSDDIYEAILEDLRSHYIAISNQDLDDSEENDMESDGHDEDEYGFGQGGEVYQNTYTPDQPAVSGAAAGGRVNLQNRNMNRF